MNRGSRGRGRGKGIRGEDEDVQEDLSTPPDPKRVKPSLLFVADPEIPAQGTVLCVRSPQNLCFNV